MNSRSLGVVVAFVCVARLGQAQSSASDSVEQQSVRELIEKFARLRNSSDGTAVAETYTGDADYVAVTGLVVAHGCAELAALWGLVESEARRIITSVDLLTPHVAVVHGRAEFSGSPALKETFVVIWKDRQWLIAIHEAAWSKP